MLSVIILVSTLFGQALLVTIHTFGDSHSRWPQSILSQVNSSTPVKLKVHHLGALLLNSFVSRSVNSFDEHFRQVQNGDIVLFALGEIDVRVHLDKWTRLRGVDEETSRLAEAYITTISHYTKNLTKVSTWIHGIVPPTDQTYNPYFPFNGQLSDRVNYTRILNAKIEKLCHNNTEIEFIDFYKLYANSDGALIPSLSDGGVHIGTYLVQSRQQIADLVRKHYIRHQIALIN
jgi:hypothetical protein